MFFSLLKVKICIIPNIPFVSNMAAHLCRFFKASKLHSFGGLVLSQRAMFSQMRSPSDAEQLWSEIAHFYNKYGDVMYENVSQTEHALQSATWAMKESGDGELAIGAFLHDIGHLIEFERKGMDHFDSDREHEQVMWTDAPYGI